MNGEMQSIVTFLAAMFSALYVLPKLSHIAKRIGLVDHPNDRKVHTVPKPLVGGIGIVISATFAALLFVPLVGLRGFFAGLALLLLVGFLDDFHDVGHRQKFLAQIFATALLIYLSKISLCNFGNLLGFGEIVVPPTALLVWPVTVFCVVGVINAINMIDGLDGLAGCLAFVAFLAYAVLASLKTASGLMLLNLAMAGAVLGFLRYNWSPSRLFMGDAGSLCLGFSLSFMAIALTQDTTRVVSPVAALLVLSVPIADTIAVMTRRILAGRSPFIPDRTHLHHTLLAAGCDMERAVIIIVSVSVCCSVLAIFGTTASFPEPLLFLAFLILFSAVYASPALVPRVMGMVYTLQRKQKPRNCPSVVHTIFRKLGKGRVFRGATRYAVHLDVVCSSYLSDVALSGEVINISRTGFLAHIETLGPLCRECVVSLTIPGPWGEGQPTEFPAEHLWTSFAGGKEYHGFQFLDLDPSQQRVLGDYLDSLG